MGAGNRSQGHFQDSARQLTSQAIGRAILYAPRVRSTTITPL